MQRYCTKVHNVRVEFLFTYIINQNNLKCVVVGVSFILMLCMDCLGPNGGPRASGSSDEGIGPETCGDIKSCSVTETRQTSSIPCRSGSNGTPAPTTLMMNSRFV